MSISGHAGSSGEVVTRTEIVDHVGHVFGSGPVLVEDLVAAAVATGARPEVLVALGAIRGQRFLEPQDLWAELPALPIER